MEVDLGGNKFSHLFCNNIFDLVLIYFTCYKYNINWLCTGLEGTFGICPWPKTRVHLKAPILSVKNITRNLSVLA